jgi:hypothetical protein
MDEDATRTLSIGTEIQSGSVVMISRDQQEVCPSGSQLVKTCVKQTDRFTFWHGLVVNISSHNDEINVVLSHLVTEPDQECFLKVSQRHAVKLSADVPVTGVENSH